MKIGIVAGEASGNLLGAGLLEELRQHQTDLAISGIGGAAMIEQGCQSLYDIDRLAVMGLIEPLRRLPELIRMRQYLYHHFSHHKPDVFIGIDSPDFNLGLEKKLRQQGIPVVHYVSPSVWAWRKKRIHKIAKATDLVLTLFPFEAAFYQEHQVPACFVGHPLADSIPLQPDTLTARKKLGLMPDERYIALLPGSRRNEIANLAETFIQTALRCQHLMPGVKFITSAANAARDEEFKAHCKRLAPTLPIQFFVGMSHDVMAAADVILVASGTATLEVMLFKKPMVIAYRMASLTYHIAKYLVKIPYVGLPNILAQEMLVPEFIQEAAQPVAMANALLVRLNDKTLQQNLVAKFTAIHEQLRCNANERAAKAVLKLINR